MLHRKKAAIPELYIGLGALKVAMGVADGVLDACEGVIEGAQYFTLKGAIPLAEDALEAARKTGDAAFNAANDTLKGVDKVTGAALDLAEKTLEGVQNGGDTVFKGAEAALGEFINVQKPVMEAAQKAIDALVKSAEWLAYQTASGALDVAKHATKALDVAKKALDLVEKGEEGVLEITKETIDGVLSVLDIQKVELGGTLRGLLGESGKHFTVSVEGVLAGGPFKFDNIDLNLADIADFIHNIFVQ